MKSRYRSDSFPGSAVTDPWTGSVSGRRAPERCSSSFRANPVGIPGWAVTTSQSRRPATLTTVPPVGVIESARLTLRPWDASDLVGLRKLAEDPAVMRYIGSGETRAPDRIEGSHARRLDRWHEHGFVERFATWSEVLSPAASADVRAVLADAAAKPARRER